jgi:hypothetical protein
MNYLSLSAHQIGPLALVLECLPVLRTCVCGEQVVQALYLSFLYSSVVNWSPFKHSWASITRGVLFGFLLWTGMPPSRLAFE